MHKKLISASLLAAAILGCDTHGKSTSPPPKVVASMKAPAALPPQPTTLAAAPDAGVTEPPDMVGLAHQPDSVNHLQRARSLKTEGDFLGALAEARRAVHDSPQDDDALDLVARLSRQVGQNAIAESALERVSAIRSDDAVPVIAWSRVVLASGDAARAVKIGQQAIERDSENPEAYHITGRAMLATDQLEGAIAMFSKAAELKPDHGYALNNLGFAYLRANMNEQAVEVLGKAAELLPQVAYVHNNLGVALERAGRMEEAEAEYMTSTTLSPKYVKAIVNSTRLKKTASLSPDEGGVASDATTVEPGEDGDSAAPDTDTDTSAQTGAVAGQPEVESPTE